MLVVTNSSEMGVFFHLKIIKINKGGGVSLYDVNSLYAKAYA